MSVLAIPAIAAKRDPTTVAPASGRTIFTCPMHPDVVLVLLGQALELRARGRVGSAIRALLNLAPP